MLVFLQPGLVFLATPKTASTAIEAALSPLAAMAVSSPRALKHTGISQFRAHLHPFLKGATGTDFKTVALIRQPRDWLGSWYRNRHMLEEGPGTSTSRVSFEEFAELACQDNPPEFARVGRQAQFLSPQPGLRVDHIFCYDRIGEFLRFLEDHLQFEIILPRLNVSPIVDLHLPDRIEQRIRKSFADDFALYKSVAAGA